MIRSKNPVDSFRYALNGILLSFKSQRHLRIHFTVAVLALLVGFILRLPRVELAVLVASISLVILAELFNTSLETVVDLVTMDYHPLAKVAKDVAAGAVMVATMNAVLVGLLLFLNTDVIRERLYHPPAVEDGLRTTVVGFLVLLLLLVMWKVRGGKGLFLHGGVVSGHTAIGFFLASVIVLESRNPLVEVLAVLLALLVAQSRVAAGIHTVQEVVFGGLLGMLVPVSLYRLIPMLLRGLAMRPLGSGS